MRFVSKRNANGKKSLEPKAYLFCCGKTFLVSLVVVGFLLVPYSFFWLWQSGDLAVERCVETQAAGDFALFGSGISQDFVDYKLRLYAKVRPEIVALGSSRVMQFRSHCFAKKFLNMGGVAGNLPVLRSTLDAMLKVHKPEAVILGLDFWWFMPTWNADPFQEEPPTSGSYTYSLANLKKPWDWLVTGKISLADFFSPLTGDFRSDRFGIMAQQTNDGFGTDGSWYNTAECTGQKAPFDFQFRDTMSQVLSGSKAFYHVPENTPAPSQAHLDAFAEIFCRLQARGIRTFVFIAPLSETIYQALRKQQNQYPHLFGLAEALRARGLNVLDLSNPRSLGANDCEFIDGFHGGEVTYLRVLRSLCDQWSALLAYVQIDKVNAAIARWKGHVLVHDAKVSDLWETDFMALGCKKRGPGR